MPDPYAAYGGAVLPAPGSPPTDPYAAYGGAAQPQQPQPPQPPAAAPSGGVLDYLKRGAIATGKAMLDPIEGAGEDVLDTVSTVGHLAHSAGEAIKPGLGEKVAPQKALAFLDKAKTPDNATQSIAKNVAMVAEFLSGKGAFDALGVADKLKAMTPIAKMMETHPHLAAALMSGIQDAAIGTTQAGAHGASPTEAVAQGTVAGAAGGVVEGVGGKVADWLEGNKLGSTSIAGEEFPTLASQEPGSTATTATTANSPAIVEQQQQGAQKVIRNMAQRAYAQSIGRVNAAREAAGTITDPARLLSAPTDTPPFSFDLPTGEAPEEVQTGEMLPDARKRQIGTAVEPGNDTATTNSKGVRKVPVFQYLTDTRPGTEPRGISVTGNGVVRITDPAVAEQHLSTLADAMRQPEFNDLPQDVQANLVDQHAQLSEALELHHAARPAGPAGPTTNPRFEKIDPSAAVDQIETYGDAAHHIQAAVQPVYQTLDKISGGQFSDLRRVQKKALAVLSSANPTSMEALNNAEAAKQTAEDGMQRIFDAGKQSGLIHPADYQAAQSAWRDSKLLDTIHARVEGAYNGVSRDMEKATGGAVQRRITKLTTDRLGKLTQNMDPADIQRVLGPDGLTNLYRVAGLLKAPETAAPANDIMQAIRRHAFHLTGIGPILGGAVGHATGIGGINGAVMGGIVEGGTRKVMHRMVTTPAAGKMLDFAARNGITAGRAGGLIAATLNGAANSLREPSQEEEPEEQPQ